MPAAFVADKLGRKWTIVPSCFGLAAALLLMAVTGEALTPVGCVSCRERNTTWLGDRKSNLRSIEFLELVIQGDPKKQRLYLVSQRETLKGILNNV